MQPVFFSSIQAKIDDAEEAWLKELVLQIGIAFATWGASKAFQVAFQFSKIGPGITWTI